MRTLCGREIVLATPTSLVQLKEAREQDPAIDFLIERWTDLLGSLVEAGNAKRLRATVKAQVVDYVALSNVSLAVAGSVLDEIPADRGILVWLNAEVLSAMASSKIESLSRKDKETVLEVTKSLALLEDLEARTPKANSGLLAAALVEGFWAMQKVTMCLSALALTLDGTLKPGNEHVAHWLCLAMRDYLEEWNTALMSHNPVLQARMAQNPDDAGFLTTEELERRLGL